MRMRNAGLRGCGSGDFCLRVACLEHERRETTRKTRKGTCFSGHPRPCPGFTLQTPADERKARFYEKRPDRKANRALVISPMVEGVRSRRGCRLNHFLLNR